MKVRVGDTFMSQDGQDEWEIVKIKDENYGFYKTIRWENKPYFQTQPPALIELHFMLRNYIYKPSKNRWTISYSKS